MLIRKVPPVGHPRLAYRLAAYSTCRRRPKCVQRQVFRPSWKPRYPTTCLRFRRRRRRPCSLPLMAPRVTSIGRSRHRSGTTSGLRFWAIELDAGKARPWSSTPSRDAGKIAPVPGAADLSAEARFTERLRLIDADTMQNDLTFYDPCALRTSLAISIRYQRVKDISQIDCYRLCGERSQSRSERKIMISPP